MSIQDVISPVGKSSVQALPQREAVASKADDRWAVLGSRAAIVAGLLFVGLITLLSMIMAQMPPTGQPEAYDELFWAIHGRHLYSLAIVFDLLIWILIGIVLVAFAALTFQRAPVRAGLIAGTGVGQVVGVIGATLRLVGTTELAQQYVQVAGLQQAAVLQNFDHLSMMIGVHFTVGSLLWSLGLMLMASSILTSKARLRWLPVLLIATGVTNIAQEILAFAAPDQLPPMSFLLVIMMLMATLFGLGSRFWKGARGLTNVPDIA